MASKNEGLPYAPGNLKFGKTCGAKSKRTGNACLAPAMKNGRCRLHGGKSTGPKTEEGKQKSKIANWKDGFYSQESIQERKAFRNELEIFKEGIKSLQQT